MVLVEVLHCVRHLSVLESSANEIFMSFNTKKTVCMAFNPMVNDLKLSVILSLCLIWQVAISFK